MKKISLLIITLIFTNLAFSQQFDFRKTNWGFNRDQVILSEKTTPSLNDAEKLMFNVEVGGLNIYVVYYFIDNKLDRSGYLLTKKHSNVNQYLKDYENTKSILSEFYGSPFVDSATWKNDTFKNDVDKLGLALSQDHVNLNSRWKTDKSTVVLLLHGGKGKIYISCMYNSRSQENDLLREIKKQE